MNITEIDNLIAEYGKEAKTTTEQDEICKSIGYKKELDYLLKIMGVSK